MRVSTQNLRTQCLTGALELKPWTSSPEKKKNKNREKIEQN